MNPNAAEERNIPSFEFVSLKLTHCDPCGSFKPDMVFLSGVGFGRHRVVNNSDVLFYFQMIAFVINYLVIVIQFDMSE
jgi:hypothetical protein